MNTQPTPDLDAKPSVKNALMRTQEEIVNRIESLKSGDHLGFKTGDLIAALDFEHAKPYLTKGTTEAQWNEDRPPYTTEAARQNIADYLEFAWGKCNDERGISADRSVGHFGQWLWLACDDAVLAAFNAAPYPQYGRPKLEVIEKHYGKAAK